MRIESMHVLSRKCRSDNVKVSTSLAWLRIEWESGRGDSTWAMLFTQVTPRQHIGNDLRLFPLLLDFLPVPWLQLLADTTLFEVLGVNQEALKHHPTGVFFVSASICAWFYLKAASVRSNRSWSSDAKVDEVVRFDVRAVSRFFASPKAGRECVHALFLCPLFKKSLEAYMVFTMLHYFHMLDA